MSEIAETDVFSARVVFGFTIDHADSAVSAWKATPELKFISERTASDPLQNILHQKWIDTFSGKTEWRRVPVEENC